MFTLKINGVSVALAPAPFAFDPTGCVWTSGDQRVYDLALEGTQETDEETNVPFQTQSAPPPVVLPRHITVLAFRNRFKAAEKVAIEIASLDDPSSAMSERQQAAALRAFMKDSETATFIDLDFEDTREGVEYLEIAGVLADGRASEILDADIRDSERMTNETK